MIRPDFVSTQEAVDDDFDKDIENFKCLLIAIDF